MKSRILPLLVTISCLLYSCSDKKGAPPVLDPAFTNYIKGFTAGVISNQSTIKIRLNEPFHDATIGEEVEDELFDFNPDIEGTAYWEDKQTIEFRPEERLPSGVIYDAEFELGDLLEVSDKLNTFEFRFQTITQEIYFDFEGMRAYEDEVLQWQQLSARVTTADFADLTDLAETIGAIQDGKPLNLALEYVSHNTYHIEIDSVQRKEEAGEVVVSWDGERIGAETEGEEVIEIPSLDDFKVMSVKVEQLPEQRIIVNFSDPVSSLISLDGLIYTEEADDFTIRKEGNKVILYPKTDLSGERKLVISKGVKNTLSYALKKRENRSIVFSSMKPEVAFVGKGNILPSADGFKLPIKAVNLSGVNVKVIKIFEDNIAQFLQSNQLDGERDIKRVGRLIHKEAISLIGKKGVNYARWNTFNLDLSNMIEIEPGAIYRVSIEFDRSQSLYPCEGEAETTQSTYTITESDLAWFDKPNAYYWDYYDDYYYDEDYNYNDRKNPCKQSYYRYGNHKITKNILASDLGIIAKSGDDNHLKVAVTDLKSATPLAGVEIEIYNYQQQLMESISTDGDGFASIDLKSKPFLLLARRGSERGYLRIDDGSALSLSMFDVAGERNTKGVKGFIYGERGVWRPGDSLYLSFILEDLNNSLPEHHPVIFELFTPENQLYKRLVRNNGLNGFYDIRTNTSSDAPTGNWRANVKVGNSTFSKTLKIEAIKPNRLKINVDFDEKVLSKGNTTAMLSARWLHGADADGLRATVEMNLSGGSTTFEDWQEYKFDDPVKEFSTDEEIVFDGNLDVIGHASFTPTINAGKNAPGMLTASFKTRVFEKGGDFSVDRFKVPFSPYDSYVGVKIPKGNGWRGALYSDEPNLIPIVTVDENGKPVNRKNVKIEIFDIRWRWWWERSHRYDLARYVSNRSENLIKSETINTVDGKALYQLEFDKNRWGRKLIRITDPISGHSTGAIFYLDYSSWWDNNDGNNPGGAEMLSFSTEKEEYQVGEDIKLNVPQIQEGRVLVSIESGSKIISTFWKDASEVQDGITFEATEEMAPNVYAHLSLIQPQSKVTNDLPIRLYGVQNIKVEAPETHLHPIIEMPDELAPEQEVELEISEKDGKAMTYTIAVVDEGLLDLTRFKTPDPWPHFYKREALGIKSWDLYEYVMGAFNGEISGLLAIGGDDVLNPGEGNKANRFEPVVRFLGPFELDEGDDNEHTFTMPNYVGSVRTMVIAGNQGAYGAAEKTTAVKQPLMVLATLPRVVSPSEELKLPVTVFAMDESIKDVEVSVETNDFFDLSSKRQNIHFNKVGDELAYFDLKVREKIGVGKVKVTVSGNGEEASHEIELNVRIPNPEIDKTYSTVIEAGKSWSMDYEPLGIKGTNKGAIEVSTIPPLNLEKRLGYLIRYPHGCVEQTTSSVFPQLYLADLFDLSSERKTQIQSNITAGLNRLRSFQLYNGGFSYWAGHTRINDWGSSYVGHFMLLAKEKGYAIPTGMYNDWLKYQRKAANSWTPYDTYYPTKCWAGSELAQAYRLYTLALAGKPTMGAMNRLRERANLAPDAQWRLAAAYALANQKDIAKKLAANIKSSTTANYCYTYYSPTRNDAMILETLSLIDETLKAKEVMDRVAEKLSSQRWLSTQSTAFSLYAIASFIGADGDDKEMKYDLDINGDDEYRTTSKSIDINELPMYNGKVSIQNKSDKRLFVQLSLSGVPLSGEEEDESNNLNMAVRYMNLDGTSIDISQITQGTDFMAEVTVRHPGGSKGFYKDMALSQLFPSGWEIRNLRMDDVSSNLIADTPDYQDIRDDRVYTYFDLPKDARRTYRVLLNAAYLGKYYLPAVECSAMYDNEIRSIKKGQWVEVVR